MSTLLAEAVQLSTVTDMLPATCQHVVPLQAYDYQGVRLLVLAQALWHQPDFHTRLFTLLCLLHRALPCQIWHAWCSMPLAYLTVYTARFVTVPAVVSCDAAMLAARGQQPFLWDWMMRHASVVVVPSQEAYEQLAGCQAGVRVSVLEAGSPLLGQRLAALYKGLQV
jgi:hypothetical protein